MIHKELWRVVVPWDREISVPGGRQHSASYSLIVRLRDAQGLEGYGHAYAMSLPAIDKIAAAAMRLAPGEACTLPQLLEVERQDDRSPECNWSSRAAACALSSAAWDLAGRRGGKSCADLWGKHAGRDGMDVYASAFFLGSTVDELVEEARSLRDRHYRKVKMRGGLSPREDAIRYEAVCSCFPEPQSVAIDFVFKSDAPKVNDFMAGIAHRPMWIEDPADYRGMDGISAMDLVAGGEACRTTAELLRLHDAGVGQIILDLQVLGGPMRFLEAARVLHALGCKVGSHTFSRESPHLLACLPDSMPVEVLDWWDVLHHEPAQPDEHGRLTIRGPGFGAAVRQDTLAAHGQLL